MTLLMNIALKIYCLLNTQKKFTVQEMREHKPSSIVVFSNTALGDTLLTTPLLASLRASFGEAKIYLFVNKKVRPLFEGLECMDGIVEYHGGFKKFISTVKALRELKPDTVLIAHANGPQDIPTAVFSGARLILKPHTKSPHKHYLSAQLEHNKQHTIEDRLDLARALGAQKITPRMVLPKRYDVCTKSTIFPNGETVVGFQVGAANGYKMWDVENFRALAKKLLQNEKIVVAVTGTQRESWLAEQIEESLGSERVLNLCGKFEIDKLPFLVRSFDVLVTNDTGTMHLAIALGVKTVSLFGLTDSATIGFYQDSHLHVALQSKAEESTAAAKKYRTAEAVNKITADEVHTAVVKLLESKK